MTVKNLEECAGRCLAEPRCKSITHRPSDRTCWLKYKVEGENGPSGHSSVQSLRADCLIGSNDGELSCCITKRLVATASHRNFDQI